MTRRTNISYIFGIIFVIGAIWIAVKGIQIYREQLDQQDWTVHTAVVTEVKSHKKSGRAHVTVYHIDYEYDVNGIIYTGRIIDTVSSRKIGDSVDIKFDPDAPENSTDILSPQPDAFLVNFLVAGMFMVIGVYVLGLYELFPKPKKKTEPIKKKAYYIDY